MCTLCICLQIIHTHTVVQLLQESLKNNVTVLLYLGGIVIYRLLTYIIMMASLSYTTGCYGYVHIVVMT